MKYQTQAPKWLLTTALLAVLGANYGFQASSLVSHQENGLFELSSGAPAPTTTANPPPLVKADEPKKEEPKKEEAKPQQVHMVVEGKVTSIGTCVDGDCKNVVLSMPILEKIAKGLVSATAQAKADAEESESECDFTEDGKPETRAQKRDRLKCEKEEKSREQRDERIAKFEDKMEDIQDKCEVSVSESKLACLSHEFNKALSRSAGRNAIPASVVQRYFKSVVGAELNKALFNSDLSAEEMMSTLQDVIDGVPEDYKGIRQSVLDTVQAQTRVRTASINQQYKQAESIKNNPQAYLQAVGDAQSQQAELSQMAEVYSAAARTSDSYTSDSGFFKYYQASYVPAMRRMFATMGPASAEDSNETLENPTRTRTRGGSNLDDVTTLPATRTGTRSTDFKTSDLSQWDFLTDSAGVRVGTPTSNARGTRGARSMGQ